MNAPEVYRTIDKFDRVMGMLTTLPDVAHCKPSTVVVTTPMIGATQTFIIQTFRQIERDGTGDEMVSKSRDTVCLQYVDDEGRLRLVIPHEAVMAIIRQHDALTTKVRKRVGKDAAAARKARGEVPGFLRGKKAKAKAEGNGAV